LSKVGIYSHNDYLKHKTGPGHPERPERLQYLIQHLKKTDVFAGLTDLSPSLCDISRIKQVHPGNYVENIQNSCKNGSYYLDSDTVVCEDSYETALLAAGAVVDACDATVKGVLESAFCAVRPPGHHAEPARAMGFCLFNNVAIAARYLQAHHSIKKVCIIDWDVHHGNGTQNAFYNDPTVFYISIHQHPLYPGTGLAEEKGEGEGEGTTLNFPSPAGFSDKEYLEIFENDIARAVSKFKPEFMLISAGFDAHLNDPLANMNVTEEGFARMTQVVHDLSNEFCQGRLVSVLEGGYDLDALSRSVEHHLRVMLK